MRWTVLIAMALLVGCGDSASNVNNTNNQANNVNNVNNVNNANNGGNNANLDGEALYNKYCAVCHGPEGTGAPVWTGSIQGHAPIRDIVQNGRSSMAPVPIGDAETALIQEYLLSFGELDITGLNGVEVYHLKCASCHGTQAEGTDLGFPIRFAHPELTHFVVRNGRPGVDYPGEMQAYPEISDQQIDEMVAWLHLADRPTNGKGLYDAMCANCHGPAALGGYANKKIAAHPEALEIIRVGAGGSPATRATYMPAWAAGDMSDAEVRLIENYLGTLPD